MAPSDALKLVEPEAAYDAYAARYDDLLRENRINAYMRKAVQRIERDTFRPGERLIELGCGTGDDALALAGMGSEVLASDPSKEMVRLAREKARRHPAGERVRFVEAHARDIGRVLAGEPDGSFDGGYSNFALSYERSLDAVHRSMARVLRSGGAFLVAVTNRLCAVEWGVAVLALRPSLAGRRLRDATPHKVGSAHTPIYCRSPQEILREFEPEFSCDRIWALPLILPPHYMNRPLQRWPSLIDILERVDPPLQGLPILRGLGDHTVIRFRRRA